MKINTTDVSVLFCCNKAFVFLLSWIVLRDRFMGVRIVAAILAIAGIVMMTYADGFHSHSVIGIALVVASASMSALYKVLFKLLLGSAKFGEAALFLSILGVFNILFITCIPIILYFTKVEYWSSFDDIPWGNLCGFSVLLLTFNIVLNFGIAVTYPTLMSLGIVLSVPVNADRLQWGPGHRHHHHRPGFSPPAPARGVGCVVDQAAHPPQSEEEGGACRGRCRPELRTSEQEQKSPPFLQLGGNDWEVYSCREEPQLGKVYIPVQFWSSAVSSMVFIGMSNLLALFHIRPSTKGYQFNTKEKRRTSQCFSNKCKVGFKDPCIDRFGWLTFLTSQGKCLES
uniref:EamA domain-containing protein n=1 Tax=Colobus angolensis palliatus TaxID=336983 RepID=A0A2K5IBG0_COLAP